MRKAFDGPRRPDGLKYALDEMRVGVSSAAPSAVVGAKGAGASQAVPAAATKRRTRE